MPNELYVFGEFTLDVTERRFANANRAVALEPKTFDVLTLLVRHAGRLVTKQQLLDNIWPESFVAEGILSVHVARLREALGGRQGGAPYIETVPRSGYRFTQMPATIVGVPRTAADHPPVHASGIHALIGRGRARVLSASLFEVPNAIAAFQAAIALDPTYPAAHAGLALAWCAQAELRLKPHAEAYGDARAAALRAIALDDRCADAHVALGAVLLMNDWDWLAAERSLERALRLNPNHSEAYVLYGRLMDALGKLEQGLGFKLKALERDADSPFVHLEIALSYWNQRRYDDVLEWAGQALAIDPRHLLARECIASVYWKKGDFDRHLAESIAHAEAYGAPVETLAKLKQVHATGGRAGVVAYAVEHLSKHAAPAQSIQLALLNGELGDMDAAFGHLEGAIAHRDPCLVHLAVAPQWDVLRGDPRFGRCLKQMALQDCF